MKLNSKALSLALGTILALVFAICAILIAFWPEATMRFFGWWGHIDLTNLISARNVTWSNFIGGTILSFIEGYILAWLFACLYNKFAEKEVSK